MHLSLSYLCSQLKSTGFIPDIHLAWSPREAFSTRGRENLESLIGRAVCLVASNQINYRLFCRPEASYWCDWWCFQPSRREIYCRAASVRIPVSCSGWLQPLHLPLFRPPLWVFKGAVRQSQLAGSGFVLASNIETFSV